MDTFEAFVERMNQYPEINTARVNYAPPEYDPAVVEITAKEFKITGEDRRTVEWALMSEVKDYIYGADKVWVRVLPEVTIRETMGFEFAGYIGYARIAKYDGRDAQ